MIEIYKKEGRQLIGLEKVEKGCWINIYPPFNLDNLKDLSVNYDIPLDFLIDSVDIDERSRFESEEGTKLILLNTPVKNEGLTESDAIFVTIPIGIIITNHFLITISLYKNPVIDLLLEKSHHDQLNPANQADFILHIFDRNVTFFLNYLKQINNLRYSFEQELYYSSRNTELNNLLKIQKSLVYFVTNLRANELMMMKMQRVDFLGIINDGEKTDFFQDIIIDNSQAMEMSEVYTKVLNGTMDTFASIISNNLNMVVKRLTSVTIILMVPTLVASFYGMNVKLPMESLPIAFFLILVISVVLSFLLIWFFVKKRWF